MAGAGDPRYPFDMEGAHRTAPDISRAATVRSQVPDISWAASEASRGRPAERGTGAGNPGLGAVHGPEARRPTIDALARARVLAAAAGLRDAIVAAGLGDFFDRRDGMLDLDDVLHGEPPRSTPSWDALGPPPPEWDDDGGSHERPGLGLDPASSIDALEPPKLHRGRLDPVAAPQVGAQVAHPQEPPPPADPPQISAGPPPPSQPEFLPATAGFHIAGRPAEEDVVFKFRWPVSQPGPDGGAPDHTAVTRIILHALRSLPLASWRQAPRAAGAVVNPGRDEGGDPPPSLTVTVSIGKADEPWNRWRRRAGGPAMRRPMPSDAGWVPPPRG